MSDKNKQLFYTLGWIFIYCIYSFIGGFIEYYLKSSMPLLVSNVILFFVLMNYADKKWKEK